MKFSYLAIIKKVITCSYPTLVSDSFKNKGLQPLVIAYTHEPLEELGDPQSYTPNPLQGRYNVYRRAAAMFPPSTVVIEPVVFFSNAKCTKASATSSAVTSIFSKFPRM